MAAPAVQAVAVPWGGGVGAGPLPGAKDSAAELAGVAAAEVAAAAAGAAV